MDLVTVRELYKNRDAYLGKEISIGGWVRSIRDSKAFGFIVVSDGTFFETLQVVYHDTMPNLSLIHILGLAIVKEIIQSHGENIDVISTPDVGTEFIFSLPKSSASNL